MKSLAAALSIGLIAVAQIRSERTVVSDADLARGIEQVKAGDFESSLISLQAAIQRLGREPSRVKEQALAFVYQGVAHLELDQEALARDRFDRALKADPDLRMDRLQFSTQQIRIFESVVEQQKAAAVPAAPRASTHEQKTDSGTKRGSSKVPLLLGATAAGGISLFLATSGKDASSSASAPASPSPGSTQSPGHLAQPTSSS